MKIKISTVAPDEKQPAQEYESEYLDWSDFVGGIDLIGKELTRDELQSVIDKLELKRDTGNEPQDSPGFVELYYTIPVKYPDETQVAIEKVKATQLFLTAILDHSADLSNMTIKVVE